LTWLPSFLSQILDFIYSTVLIFTLIYFEWRGTENEQFADMQNPGINSIIKCLKRAIGSTKIHSDLLLPAALKFKLIA